METKRTIIDILRKGNQELFHSDMIAWLLDSGGEHGLGGQFLKGFADALSANGCKTLKQALAAGATPSVSTEVVHQRGRYDIEIALEGHRIVVENKTKSIGDTPQFERYRDGQTALIALGFCDVSFTREAKQELEDVTFVVYADILAILQGIELNAGHDYAVLVRHYRDFLERELLVLRLLDEVYGQNREADHDDLVRLFDGVSSRTGNDGRFLNLYFFNKFQDHLAQMGGFGKWHMNKNARSGTWMSDYGELPEDLSWSSSIMELLGGDRVNMWFHLQLTDEALMASPDTEVGLLQIRTHPTGSNREFVDLFKDSIPLGEGMVHVRNVSEKSGDIMLAKRVLTRQDLCFERLSGILREFMGHFSSVDA
jgi:hypothetical protein